MKVLNVMTKDVLACSPVDTLAQAARILWENDCGCVPVVDSERRVAGIVTDRDICMAAYIQGASLAQLRVECAMARRVHTCRPQDDAVSVLEVMKREQVRRLPVVDGNRRLIGIVSLNDLAAEAANERPLRRKDVTLEDVGQTLATIGAHRQRREEALVEVLPRKPLSPVTR